jgi:membrane-bound lytic murein transglycosylase MltF
MYHKNIEQISNNTGGADWKRFEQTIALFEQYGPRYGFDPVMLAAQGYQESQLRQDAKSRVGAIGVMQIMPSTGKELNVGDIRKVEPNIHAGAKYMDKLMTKYFQDAKFSETNRALFRSSLSRATTPGPATSRRCAGWPSSAGSTPTSGSTTSRS